MNFLKTIMGGTIAFLERIAWQGLGILFAYAFFTSFLTRNTQIQLYEQNSNDQHAIQGILTRSDDGYDFFDFSPMNYEMETNDLRENTPLNGIQNFTLTSIAKRQLTEAETKPSVRIGGPDALVVQNDTHSSVYSPQEAKHYPLTENDGMLSVTTARNNGIIYTTTKGNALRIHYLMQCKDPLTIDIQWPKKLAPKSKDSAYMGFPLQNELLTSPTENRVLILHHIFDDRIWIANLESGQTERLDVPKFGERQIHAAPFFVNGKTVAFSVWEDGRGATVLYHADERSYELLSDAFSDDIHVSTKGELVLSQSFARNAGNIPYGSVRMAQKKAYVDRQVVQSIFGEETAWENLFENPESIELQFKKDAKNLFRDIIDPAKRMQITKLWNDIYDPFIQRENILRILTLSDGKLRENTGILYFTDENHPVFQWNDATLLLQALHIPGNIIREYAMQREKRLRDNDSYTLIEIR